MYAELIFTNSMQFQNHLEMSTFQREIKQFVSQGFDTFLTKNVLIIQMLIYFLKRLMN